MSDLTEALARWDDMTDAERDALVAVHVMGWHLYYRYWWTEGEGSPPQGHCTGKNEYGWNPTTDRNDCAEAVEAFEKAGIGTAFFENRLKKIMLNRGQNVRCMGAADWIKAAPKDVCRAMLEARAKGAK